MLLACGTASPAQQPTSESTAATRQAEEPTSGSAAANPSGTTRGQDGDAAGKRQLNSTTPVSSTGGTSASQSRPTPSSDASAANTPTGAKPSEASGQKPSSPDVEALIALYRATDGDNWNANSNWLSDNPVGTWHGVSTNDAGRVQALNLNDNQLDGHLPDELGNLAGLRSLNVAGNRLSGPIPEEMANLPLVSLDLSRNQLSGPIPAGLGELAAQWGTINLSENPDLCVPAPEHRLVAALLESKSISTRPQTCQVDPATVEGDREALVALYQVTGGDRWKSAENWLSPQPLDTWLGVHTDASGRVSALGLRDNGLTGTFPMQIMQLAHLTVLDLGTNPLTGEIPQEIGGMTYLELLNLSDTQLTGTIPDTIGNLRYLNGLFLRNNELTGEVPGSLGNLRHLGNVDLSGNQLTGAIPPELGNLAPDHDRGYPGLTILNLSNNQLSGEIPEELAALQGSIDLWNNPITGCLPSDWEARVTVDLYPCGRGANDNPEGWLQLLAGKDDRGNDLYPEPIIVTETRRQVLGELIGHLVEWIRVEDPDKAGFYNDGQLGVLFRNSWLEETLKWEPLWSQAPDLKIRINGRFMWEAYGGEEIEYQITAVGVFDTMETSDRDWTREYLDNYGRVPIFSRFQGTPEVEKLSR